MFAFNTKDIAARHMLLIAGLGEKSEAGELVGDLVRASVRTCLIEMQAAGAETDEVRQIFEALLIETAKLGEAKPKFMRVLEEVRNHMEFLLFLEEKHERNLQVNPSSPLTAKH